MAATIAVLLMSTLGVAFLSSRRAGLVAALVMAAALGLVVEAHLAKADAALLAAVMTGQLVLGLVYVGLRNGRPVHWRLAVVFWLAEAAGILLKGPPAPALALLTVVTLSIADRDIRWIKALRPTLGFVLMGLIVAPWFVAIEQASAGGFLAEAFQNDFLSKLVSAQEAHGAPPGAYVAVSLASFWPGSLFLVPALIWGWRGRRTPPQRFLLAWLAPAWLVLELMPTKLPNYVLPVYPALALLVAGALTGGDRLPLTGFARLVDVVAKVLWGAVTIALAAALAALPLRLGPGLSAAAILAAVAMLALALLLLLYRGRSNTAAGLVTVLAAAFVLPAASVVAPGLDALWLSRSAAALLARHPPHPGKAVLSVGYREPSVVFLLGTATRLATATPPDGQLAGAGMALVSDRDDAIFRQSLTTRGLSVRAIGRVSGLDYSVGESSMILTLYDLEPG